jgi:hypothetical protein
VKALTLTQPWATLVAIGAKRRDALLVDALGWSQSTRRRARPSARSGLWGQFYVNGFHDVIRASAAIEGPDELPRGVILCVVELVDVDTTWEIGKRLDRRELLYGNYGPGRFAWSLEDVRALDEPAECRGALGLWDVPADLLR